MTDLVVVASLEKNSNERVRVALDTFHEVRLIDVRITVPLTTTCDVQTPTKKGVAMKVEHLPALLEALRSAEMTARELGWLPAQAA